MSSFIVEKIKNIPEKKISYATFVDWALYDAKDGYYMKEQTKVGKDGDFYTSSLIHSVFSKLFAKTFVEIFTIENLPPTICEFGGGNGKFAKGVLDEIKNRAPELMDKLTYIMIETSPYHRKLQKDLLGDYPQVKIYDSFISAKRVYPHFNGIVFSNELFDALPVHLIEKNGETIYEIFVSVENDELVEIIEPCQNEEILAWLNQYGPTLKDKQKIEIPLAMTSLLQELAAWINHGCMFTIDYGYTKEDWQSPERMDGSLRGFYKHQLITNPLLYVGDMDLTTHIHIDAFIQIGEENGLTTILSIPQDRFLLQAGILDFLEENYDPNPFSEKSKQNRAIRSFVFDGHMSRHFQVIVQGKNLNEQSNYPFLKSNPFMYK